jgi:hypothetical protein
MVGLSSGTLPTRVQILVLTPFPAFSRIYQRYALGGKVLIGGRVCVRVFIGVSVFACYKRLRCIV